MSASFQSAQRGIEHQDPENRTVVHNRFRRGATAASKNGNADTFSDLVWLTLVGIEDAAAVDCTAVTAIAGSYPRRIDIVFRFIERCKQLA